MSQPYKDANSSSSSSRPPLGQSHTIPFGPASPQNVLNQKLIPRDFLGIRSRPSIDTISSAAAGDLRNAVSKEFLHNGQDSGLKERDEVLFHSRNPPVASSGKATPDSDLPASNELKFDRTRSPESLGSPFSFKKPSATVSNGTPPVRADAQVRPIMPRNSSIDSAVSSMSASSISKAVGEAREPSPSTVHHLIATAGGPENLIAHLLKDKNHISSQNAQLWKLVEKQRALLLGLNKDLERITKERDRFKNKVKEMQSQADDRDVPSSQAIAHPVHDDLVFEQHSVEQDPKASLKQAQNMANGRSLGSVQNGAPVARPPVQADQDKENMLLPNAVKLGLPEVQIDHAEPAVSPQTIPKLDTLMATPPVFNIIEASPLIEKSGKGTPSSRKAPPKPLNLMQGTGAVTSPDQDTGKSEASSIDEDDERGRRKTREDDDRERERSAIKAEAEARSRSKKSQPPKSLTINEHKAPAQVAVPAPLPTPGLPLSPRPQHAQTFVAPQNNLTVASISQPTSIGDRLLAAPLKSPGLPMSPRPLNSTINNSLPLSPRINMSAMPLSPRAPKHALPVPTNPGAPADAAALQKRSEAPQTSKETTAPASIDRLQVHQPIGSEPPPVYRGLVASAYPNLLLPPNALPSIQVQVHSSRLRPSRHSVLGLKNQEESTIFSLSIISRSSNSELWRVEKMPNSLPHLEQQLRPRCPELPKMPDRRLFVGQSPALLDERRQAIDNYFDELLDTHVDEQAAVTICRFLSVDVVDPEHPSRHVSGAASENNFRVASPDKPITKVGYLTKKGKNFGGWKSRFFILDGAEFRYYESSGGTHLGTIRLQNALIGKQRDTEPTEETDGQFRHAFLIQEPKRKDSATYIKHILCAESDAERDDWVRVLLYWVEGAANGVNSGKTSQNALVTQNVGEIDSQHLGIKPGISMKEAMQTSKETHINTSTPTSVSSVDSSILDAPPATKSNISGPLNGGIITDASSWGSKPGSGIPTKDVKEKTHKMSNIFGFKKPDLHPAQPDQKPAKPRILRHNGYVRAAFGLPLAEAVEFCAPFNVEVELPAVAYRCIEYLRERDAANEEGLFRLSGSNVVVRSLKERFNTEGDIDLVQEDEIHDVHAVASLFKTYLRELPSTLLTRDLHIEFLKVLELESHSDKVIAYNNLVHRLPPANFTLLKEMSSYLLEVTRNADKNKMSVRNVGIVFSPTLNIPTPVFTLFLTEYAAIFNNEPEHASNVRSTEVKVAQDLTPDEIRSPRHQMFTDLPTPAPHQTTFSNPTAMAPPRGTMTGTGELGFMPIHPSYESGNYVSVPRTGPVQPLTQAADSGGYNSLNGLLAPSNTVSEKAKRRESAILFTN